jgi:hypothetical protein
MQVQGKGPADVYTVFPYHFCSCHSFFYDVASKGNAVYVSQPLYFPSWQLHCVTVNAGRMPTTTNPEYQSVFSSLVCVARCLNISLCVAAQVLIVFGSSIHI